VSSRPTTTALPRQEATDGGMFVTRAFIKHLLLTSVTPDGKAVATAVRAARDGDRVYFRLSSGSATARRLRQCDWVQVAPSSALGFVSYGPPAGATARPLTGPAASRAAACLDRDPAWRRAARSLLHRVTGWRNEYYEVRPDPVAVG
jgi:PPOX class probable F420-dependent enzyme